ncbi:MAG: phosphopyruvate hydratase [Candidatus Woesearchaeota archaeon]|nr:phosphopyruvate hydratase [Candidatus Woesearchaeota archaeon]
MAGFRIIRIKAREILDSRGFPTVEADVITSKALGRAIAPSGASTGIYEALELRDKEGRFFGKGVEKAVANINGKIAPEIIGLNCKSQKIIDKKMLRLDGTKNKSNLGANAILPVSMASARAASIASGIPLYRYLNSFAGKFFGELPHMILPIPFSNVINGGKHAGTGLKIQEFMIAPTGAKSFREAVQMVSETYHSLKKILEEKFGKSAVNVGDEGGFAPPIEKPEDALSILEKAVSDSGYSGKIKLAIDSAASEFFSEGKYHLDKPYSAEALTDYYLSLAESFPIVSFEDPFEQNDFFAYRKFTAKIKAKYGDKIQVVGDDLLATNPKRIRMGIRRKACSALLLKLNQIGTVSEAISAARLAMKSGWNVMVSHRSGETEDTFIADLAVALGCGEIKLGAPARGERTAKFNELIRIEEELSNSGKADYASNNHA